MSTENSTKLSDTEISYWVAFNRISNVGPARFALLRNHFPDMRSAWNASISELEEAKIPSGIAEKIIFERATINPEEELYKVIANNLKIITLSDDSYPALLREIHNPPPILYCKGTVQDPKDTQGIAIVGTRKNTTYGARVTESITRELTENECTIVSGLALGIDSIAHRACLRAKGRTIAVLACGLETVYPSSHERLAREIIENNGLLCSEFPIGTKSFKSNFPQRNRIISGMTRGTLIVEATKKSGSLITANCALEQNREVFAVPGSVFSSVSQGPNSLISQGATLVTGAKDIMVTFNMERITTDSQISKPEPDNPIHKKIYDLLGNESCHIDDIVVRGELDARNIHSILVTMELNGYLKEDGGGYYTRL